jgi:hypothetical protein
VGGAENKLRLIPLLEEQTAPNPAKEALNAHKRVDLPRDRSCGFCGLTNHVESKCRNRKRAIEALAAKKPQKLSKPNNSVKKDGKIGSLLDSALSASNKSIFDAYPPDSINAVRSDHTRLHQTDATIISMMVDSGCSTHSFKDQSSFADYSPVAINTKFIRAADNSALVIAGLGTVSVRVKSSKDDIDSTLNLRNVNHVPTLHENYFSVSTAADNGMITVFDESTVRLYNASDSRLIASGERQGDVYYLIGRLASPQLAIINSLSTSNTASGAVWHARMGHACPRRVKSLLRGLATGIKISG